MVEFDSLAKESDPLQLLKRILNSSLKPKFALAKELVAVYSIEDVVLSSFIYREIQKALSFNNEEFNEFDVLGNFENVISICKDATILGNRIFYGLKKYEDAQLETDKQGKWKTQVPMNYIRKHFERLVTCSLSLKLIKIL